MQQLTEDPDDRHFGQRVFPVIMRLPEGILNVTVFRSGIREGRPYYLVSDDVRIMGKRVTDPSRRSELRKLVHRSINSTDVRVH